MEEQKNPQRNMTLSIVLSIMAAVLLSASSIGSFFYVLPLTILGYYFKETHKAVICQIITVMLCCGILVYQLYDMFEAKYMGYILMSAYFVVAPGIFCILYTGLRDWSSSVLRKIVASGFTVIAIGLTLSVWLGSENGEFAYQGLVSVFDYAYSQLGALGFDTSMVSEIISQFLLYAVVPIGLVLSVLPVLIAESIVHRFDSGWQSGFAFMKMPGIYSYLFIGLCIATAVVTSFNLSLGLERVLWNLSFAIGIYYLINGFSLFFFWRRKLNQNYLSGRAILLLVVAVLLPVVGLLVCLALVIAGLLETWINFR